MTQSQSTGPKCPDCDSLKLRIRTHLNAFEVLATLSPTLSWSILKKNIEGILDQQDDQKKQTGHDGSTSAEVNSTTQQPHQTKMDAIMMMPKATTVPCEEISETITDEPEKAEQEKEEPVVETIKENQIQSPPPTLSSRPHQQQQEPNPVAHHHHHHRQSSGRSKRTRGNLNESWEGQCRILLKDLWSRDDAWPFRQPVTNLPDYRQLIDTPMCLTWVQSNLYKGEYQTPKDFHRDMMLIFHNARIYNTDPNSPIRPLTQSLENYYESHQLLQKILRQDLNFGSKSNLLQPSSPVSTNDNYGSLSSWSSNHGQKRQGQTDVSGENGPNNCKKRRKIVSNIQTTTSDIQAEQVEEDEEKQKIGTPDKKLKDSRNFKMKSQKNLHANPRSANPKKRRVGRPFLYHQADEYIRTKTVDGLDKKIIQNQKSSRRQVTKMEGRKWRKIQIKNRHKPASTTFHSDSVNSEKDDDQKILHDDKQQQLQSIVVRNPFPNFNFKKATRVKVRINQLKFPCNLSKLLKTITNSYQNSATETEIGTTTSPPFSPEDQTVEKEMESPNLLEDTTKPDQDGQFESNSGDNDDNSTSNLEPPPFLTTENHLNQTVEKEKETVNETIPFDVEPVQNGPIKNEQNDTNTLSLQNGRNGFKYFLSLLNLPDITDHNDTGLFSSISSSSSSNDMMMMRGPNKFANFVDYRDKSGDGEDDDDDDDRNEQNEEEGDDEEPEMEDPPYGSAYSAPCGVSRRIPIVFQMKGGSKAKVSETVRKKIVSSRQLDHNKSDSEKDDESFESESSQSSWSEGEARRGKKVKMRKKKKRPSGQQRISSKKVLKNEASVNEVLTKFRIITSSNELPSGPEGPFPGVLYECQLCKKVLRSKGSLARHLHTLHEHPCVSCGTNYFGTLEEHQAVCSSNSLNIPDQSAEVEN